MGKREWLVSGAFHVVTHCFKEGRAICIINESHCVTDEITFITICLKKKTDNCITLHHITDCIPVTTSIVPLMTPLVAPEYLITLNCDNYTHTHTHTQREETIHTMKNSVILYSLI